LEYRYRCIECNKTYDITPDLMLCPVCSQRKKADEPLIGILEVQYFIRDKSFSYDKFLPVEKEFFPKIPVGDTPLWEPENLRKKFNMPNFFIKDDSANPTGSFKDRASYMVAAFAIKHNISDITLASTGNAGSSMAGIGAAAGLNITLFLPKNAPRAKIVQALQYGARVIPVDGNYDAAYKLSLQYSKINGSLNRNTAYNPMTIEGKKTVSFEIFTQLKKTPDYIFVPTGDGCILSGVYKGFKDLVRYGFADKIPIIYCVQAEKSDAISQAFKTGKFQKIASETIADSISVDVPGSGYHALKQLKKYSGRCITVEDREILEAQKQLSETTGLFAEPAGATAFAGFLKEKDNLEKKAAVVILCTGSGLKDTASAQQIIQYPDYAIKNIDEIEKIIDLDNK